MNPFPFVYALIARDWWATLGFAALIALATALGVAITSQEKALRTGSAKAADRFDMIVAAPGSQTDALLKTIFLRPGVVELLAPEVIATLLDDNRAAFAAPLGFGDNHNGNPLAGTTADLVLALSNGSLAEGRMFATADEAVVGAASPLMVGAELHAEHGHGEDEQNSGEHGTALKVTGRMQPTGSPWDRAIIVPIEQMWLVHNLPIGHSPLNRQHIGSPFDAGFLSGVPAVIVKPLTLSDAYRLRGAYRSEKSTAFFPAEVLLELYDVMGDVRRLMSVMAIGTQALVVAAIVAGVIALLRVHRRQFAMLRALGAPRRFILASIWLYVAAMVGTGALVGLALGFAAAKAASHFLSQSTGIELLPGIGGNELALVAGLLIAGCVFALIPALRFCREPVIDALR